MERILWLPACGILLVSVLFITLRRVDPQFRPTARASLVAVLVAIPMSYMPIPHGGGWLTGGFPFPVLYTVSATNWTTTNSFGVFSLLALIGNAAFLLLLASVIVRGIRRLRRDRGSRGST